MTANDSQLAADIARAAGELLLRIRGQGAEQGKELGKRGDREANALILSRLHEARPDDFVLSEEARDDRARCDARRVWIVDPLDGTREYGEGRADWAVHIGLAIDGRAVAGAVALPAQQRVLRSDDAPAQTPRSSPLRMVVSRTRAPGIATRVAAAIGAELVPMGSAGAKAMAVVMGEADLYLHAGGQYEWDNCAPAAVASGAGFHVSRLDGGELVYNRIDPLLPDLLVCRPDILPAVRAAIDRELGSNPPA